MTIALAVLAEIALIDLRPSSAVALARFDPEANMAIFMFHGSPTLYYYPCSPGQWAGYIGGESAGASFHEYFA